MILAWRRHRHGWAALIRWPDGHEDWRRHLGIEVPCPLTPPRARWVARLGSLQQHCTQRRSLARVGTGTATAERFGRSTGDHGGAKGDILACTGVVGWLHERRGGPSGHPIRGVSGAPRWHPNRSAAENAARPGLWQLQVARWHDPGYSKAGDQRADEGAEGVQELCQEAPQFVERVGTRRRAKPPTFRFQAAQMPRVETT